jgi:predicted acetyltransferase
MRQVSRQMQIRQLTAEEFEERIALSQFAFQLQLPPDRLEHHRKVFRPEEDWGAFDDEGKLLSAMKLLPLETWIQGKKFAMGGLAGVATWPEARRQGCVSKLLVHGLKTMKESGQTVSMLHPFMFGFYRKFGWENTIERKFYTIATNQLPQRVETPGEVKRMANPDLEVLSAIYEAYASRYSGTLVRSRQWWNERMLTKTGSFAVYYDEIGTAKGYVFYQILDRTMTIHDWASLTETSRRALWTFVANHDSMIERVTMIAPIDDPLPFLLADPRIKQEVIPYFMSRIVDAEAFVAEYPWEAGDTEEEVIIALTDAHAPWNNGDYFLRWSANGAGRLARIGEGAKEGSAIWVPEIRIIKCDIQSLTAMLMGNRKPSLLLEFGRIQGAAGAVATLERRIPARTTHLMDFF